MRGLFPEVSLGLGSAGGCAENQDPGVRTILASQGGSGHAEVKVACKSENKTAQLLGQENPRAPQWLGRMSIPQLAWPHACGGGGGEPGLAWTLHVEGRLQGRVSIYALRWLPAAKTK